METLKIIILIVVSLVFIIPIAMVYITRKMDIPVAYHKAKISYNSLPSAETVRNHAAQYGLSRWLLVCPETKQPSMVIAEVCLNTVKLRSFYTNTNIILHPSDYLIACDSRWQVMELENYNG